MHDNVTREIMFESANRKCLSGLHSMDGVMLLKRLWWYHSRCDETMVGFKERVMFEMVKLDMTGRVCI